MSRLGRYQGKVNVDLYEGWTYVKMGMYMAGVDYEEVSRMINAMRQKVSLKMLFWTSSEILEKVRVDELKLSRLEKDTIPKCAFQTQLSSLSVRLCHLQDMTPVLAIKGLTKLHLRKNKIRVLPDDLWQLENLQELQLDTNKIVVIPESYTRFTKLTNVSLTNNRLEGFPWQFVNCDTKVTLSGNPFLIAIAMTINTSETGLVRNYEMFYKLTALRYEKDFKMERLVWDNLPQPIAEEIMLYHKTSFLPDFKLERERPEQEVRKRQRIE